MKRRYERTPAEVLELMPNTELLESYEIVCMTTCNAHNFTRYGPSAAMREDREAHALEILRRMHSPAPKRNKHKKN